MASSSELEDRRTMLTRPPDHPAKRPVRLALALALTVLLAACRRGRSADGLPHHTHPRRVSSLCALARPHVAADRSGQLRRRQPVCHSRHNGSAADRLVRRVRPRARRPRRRGDTGRPSVHHRARCSHRRNSSWAMADLKGYPTEAVAAGPWSAHAASGGSTPNSARSSSSTAGPGRSWSRALTWTPPRSSRSLRRSSPSTPPLGSPRAGSSSSRGHGRRSVVGVVDGDVEGGRNARANDTT